MAARKSTIDLRLLLARFHPRMYRIAIVLTGDRQCAERVVDKVLRQSAGISRKWENQEQASRWFARYTVLLSRRWAGESPMLALRTVTTDPCDPAIISAIGQLPMQQREAFLLHHGESMELRQIATAMDCSSAAATNHLLAATAALKQSVPGDLDDFISRLPELLRKLLPPADILEVDLQRALAAQRHREQVRFVLLWSHRVVILIAIAWLLWWIWQHVSFNAG